MQLVTSALLANIVRCIEWGDFYRWRKVNFLRMAWVHFIT